MTKLRIVAPETFGAKAPLQTRLAGQVVQMLGGPDWDREPERRSRAQLQVREGWARVPAAAHDDKSLQCSPSERH